MLKYNTFPALAASFLFTAVALVANAQDTAPAKHSLSPDQLAAFKKIKADVEKEATPLVIDLAATAKSIVSNMLLEKEDQALRSKLSKHLHQTAGRLLDIKGQSFRRMLAVLTPEQRSLLRSEVQKPGVPPDIGELMDRVFELGDTK